MHVRFCSLVKSASPDAVIGIIVAMTHIAAISVIAQTSPVENSNIADNPLLTESSLPYHVPPFDKIKDEHFVPAIEAGMRDQLKEVEVVANDSEKPTFDNTIVALERTGRLLDRAERTFSNLNACNTNPNAAEDREGNGAETLRASRRDLSEREIVRARRRNFTTIATNSDSIRNRLICSSVITRISSAPARSFPIPTRKSSRRSTPSWRPCRPKFEQNVLKEKNASSVVVDRKGRSGRSFRQPDRRRGRGRQRRAQGRQVCHPPAKHDRPAAALARCKTARCANASCKRRSRETAKAARSTLATSSFAWRSCAPRRAKLLGYANHAAYQLEDQTAGNVPTVNKLLADLAPPAVANAKTEAADMQKIVDQEKGGFQIASWDWDFYSEKVRKARYAFDESELRTVFRIQSRPARWRFFCRRQALRSDLQGTSRSSGLSAGCARVRSLRSRWQTARAVSRRLLCAAFKARRRMDECLRAAKRACSGRSRWWPITSTFRNRRRANRLC